METSPFHRTPTPILRIGKQVPRPCSSRMMITSGCRGLQSLHAKPKVQRFGDAVTAKCAAWDLGLEEDEEEEEEWMKVGRLREKCEEREGMVELLECLEKEAIEGEDEGREASDYNRRAQMFDKSSRVFKAIKASNGEPNESQTS